MIAIRFYRSTFFHAWPKRHGVQMYLPHSRYCLSGRYYQWLGFGVAFELRIYEQGKP